MKPFGMIIFAGVLSFFLAAPAGAVLVNVVNSDFSGSGTGQWVSSSSYTGQTGWVESGVWTRSNGGSGSNYWAELNSPTEGGAYGGYVSQVIPFTGSAGTITLTFDTQYYLAPSRDSNPAALALSVTLFGRNTQPDFLSWSSATAFGTQIGDIYYFNPPATQSTFASRTFTVDNVPAYSYYTIRFAGILWNEGSYVRIDNAALDVAAPSAVPIPAAAWLLGSGLAGLVAIRRLKK